MITLNKYIKISEDRRLHLDFDLPADAPTGEVNVDITITPIQPKITNRTLESFCGILKDNPIFTGDAVEFQRKIRDE
jgi:hypothetical protein